MKIGVLITNNSPRHPADKWADVTAQRVTALIAIDDDSGSATAIQARKDKRAFENKLNDLLTDHHQAVQDNEAGLLDAMKDERFSHTLNPLDHLPEAVDQAVADIVEASKVNPLFEAFFADPKIQAHIKHDMLVPSMRDCGWKDGLQNRPIR